MANTNFSKIKTGIQIFPKTSSSVGTLGDMDVDTSSNKLNFHNGTSASPVVTEAHSSTLTNKSIDATANTITNLADTNIGAGAAIAYSKLALTGSVVNADISASAAIAYSKLSLAGSIVNSDVSASAAIAYSKLSLAGSIVNADISNSAAIAYSKLSLSGSILNADISASAAISRAKIAAGTVAQVLINDPSTGLLSSESTLAKSRGGSGQDNSSLTFPASGTLATLAGTETLSNKTFSDAITEAQISTPANPSSGFNKIYFKSDGNPYTLNSAGVEKPLGSGSGTGKNYLSAIVTSQSATPNTGNGNFELGSTTGWSLAHTSLSSLVPSSTAAAGTAFDSTHGGSAASGNLSFAVVSSSQLAGSYSGSLVSSAASTAGDLLISSAFNIDTEDQAKMQTITFAYKSVSGTFDFSGTSTNSFAVYVYDVTNAAWIQPAGVYNLVQGTGVGQCVATFQTTSNSTKYQLALVNINSTSGAYTLYVDDFSVGPQTVQKGPAMSDMTSYTPTYGAGFGTVTNSTVFWGRRGDRMIISGTFTTGTVAGSLASISLPTGYTLDSTKLTGSSVPQNVGILQRKTAGAGYQTTTLNVLASLGSSSTNLYFAPTDGGSPTADALTPQNGNSYFGSTESQAFYAEVPITGWSSNSVMSSDTDTRTVAFSVSSSGSQSVTASVTNIAFNTTTEDTHTAWSGSTYVVPVSGDYAFFLTGIVPNSGTTAFAVFPYVNGSTSFGSPMYVTTNGNNNSGCILLSKLKANDIVSFRANASLTIAASAALQGFRLSGPAVVAASEKVYLQYTGNGGTSITSGTTNIDFSTKVVDSHGAWNGTTFTAPRSGWYDLEGCAQITASTASNYFIYVNGVQKYFIGMGNLASANKCFSGGTYLNANDVMSIRSDTSETLSNSSTSHWIAIRSQG